MRILKSKILFVIAISLWCTQYVNGQSREIQLFNSGWKFLLDDKKEYRDTSYDDSKWRRLDLPHDWSIENAFDLNSPAGAAGGYLPGGTGYYRKTFFLPEESNGKRIKIHFDGAYMNSSVFLNGVFLGNRPYGFSSFEYDLTPYLKFGNNANVLAVRIDNSLQPNSRWYAGSGINRNVYLIVLNQQHFKQNGVFAHTNLIAHGQAIVEVDCSIVSNNYPESQLINFQPSPDSLKRISKPARIEAVLLDGNEKIVANSDKSFTLEDYSSLNESMSVMVQNPKLWSHESPYLYKLAVRLVIGDKILDEVVIPYGIREIKFDKSQGMLVNGKKVILKGVCLHKDAGSFGTAVPQDVWKYRLEKLKAMGCNGIRTHGPVDPLFLDMADKMGFYVMAEAFDEWNSEWQWGRSEDAQGKVPYGYHLFFNQWAEMDLKDMVSRDRNHSCVVMYSMGNEVPNQRNDDGHEILDRLTKWCHEADPTRLTTAACDWPLFAGKNGFFDAADIAGYNYVDRNFPNLYADVKVKHPNQIVLGTETYMDLKNWISVRDNPFVVGEFLWSGIDYLGEASGWPNRGWKYGLIDLAGFEKPTYYIRQAYWSNKPMVHIGVELKKKDNFRWQCFNVGSHWNFNKEEVDSVHVFSNCDQAELILNGKSLGRKPIDKNTYSALWMVEYKKGELKSIGYNKGKQVAVHILRTAGEPFKINVGNVPNAVRLGDGKLLFIPVSITDKKSVRCPFAENELKVTVKGSGQLIGFDTGDQSSHELYKTNVRKAYEGRALLTVKPTGTGMIEIEITSPGIVSERFNVNVN
ncbi:MAG: glycoside hydrolase family 2 TIM barrel-domain containing protein [Bacteroidota bacterium]|nr:glycoside hydrolase family 2 TIM barrel-domain containing protein [Bacteroidota bacterium]